MVKILEREENNKARNPYEVYPRKVHLKGISGARELNDLIHSDILLNNGSITEKDKIFESFKNLNKYLLLPFSEEEINKKINSILESFLLFTAKNQPEGYGEITIFDSLKKKGRDFIAEIRFNTLISEIYKKIGNVEGNYLDWGFGDGSLGYILHAYHNGKIPYDSKADKNCTEGICINEKMKYYSSDLDHKDSNGNLINYFSSLDGSYIKPNIITQSEPEGKSLKFNNGEEVKEGFFNVVISALAGISEKQFSQMDRSLKNNGYFIRTTRLGYESKFNNKLLDSNQPVNSQLNIDEFVYNNPNYILIHTFQMYEFDDSGRIADREVVFVFKKQDRIAENGLRVFRDVR